MRRFYVFKRGEIYYAQLRNPETNTLCTARSTGATGLKQALIRLSVGNAPSAEEKAAAEAAWKERNIVFHSWRHFYAARMADHVDARVVMQATGHKTASVFNAYAAHATEEDFKKVGKATKRIFAFTPDSPEAKKGRAKGSKAVV